MEADTTRPSSWRTRARRTAAVAAGALAIAGLALVGTGTATARPMPDAAQLPDAAAGPDSAAHAARHHCAVGQLLRNRGFERPVVAAHAGAWQLFPNGTADLTWRSLDGTVELWRTLGAPHQGAQHAEINATGDRNIIWQAFRTVPRTRISWSVALKARDFNDAVNRDTTVIRFNGKVVQVVTVTDAAWTVVSGTYRVPRGQRITRFSLQSVRHAGPAGHGNLVDSASVRGVRCG